MLETSGLNIRQAIFHEQALRGTEKGVTTTAKTNSVPKTIRVRKTRVQLTPGQNFVIRLHHTLDPDAKRRDTAWVYNVSPSTITRLLRPIRAQKKISDEQRAIIRRLFHDHPEASKVDVASAYDVSRGSIYRILNEKPSQWDRRETEDQVLANGT
ncbi:hypothetical protein FRB94_009784 [Tulasnella sp. JGI-2019a]|nr:hypothetical protein FRB93_009015 [Tulasnella sp. JGI-2019a]KAG8994563.1 hypothetical protein FRB94_009784 [Tulasnella sp. JGI-2019a]